MKKISYLIFCIVLSTFINGCTGYEPIFGSSSLQFKIANHSIEGEKALGGKIYTNLYKLSISNKIDKNSEIIDIFIKVSKSNETTSKDSSGKILEYKITLNTNIIINDFLTDEEILKQEFTNYSNYKVQDQHSETKNLENKTLENLIDKTHQDILIRISEKISKK